MERTDIVNRRMIYLGSVFRYRKAERDIVYVDERYVHSSHHVTKCWKSNDVDMNVSISKGVVTTLFALAQKMDSF